MSIAEANRLAHELTMEYIRNNPSIIQGTIDDIPKMVDDIADIQTKFRDAIKFHEVWSKLF